MGHSLGVSDSYVRFTEDERLEDYIKTIDYLTVNQTVVLINKSLRKQEETVQNSLRDMEQRHKIEIESLHKEYENQFESYKESAESLHEAMRKIEQKQGEIFEKTNLNKKILLKQEKKICFYNYDNGA
jgi:hypothetical protein